MSLEQIIDQAVDREIRDSDPGAFETQADSFWRLAWRLLTDYGYADNVHPNIFRTP